MKHLIGLILAAGLAFFTRNGAAFSVRERRSQPVALQSLTSQRLPRRRCLVVSFMSVDGGVDGDSKDASTTQVPKVVPVKCPNCDKCDGSGRYVVLRCYCNKERNCVLHDASTLMFWCCWCCPRFRILGGLGAVLPWMPVKAYRPCPNFIERGGDYQRSGQGLDEIAFGAEGKKSK